MSGEEEEEEELKSIKSTEEEKSSKVWEYFSRKDKQNLICIVGKCKQDIFNILFLLLLFI